MARRRKKAQVTRRHKYLKIEVKFHSRRFGDSERARAHAMIYQMLPLVLFVFMVHDLLFCPTLIVVVFCKKLVVFILGSLMSKRVIDCC
ncbi:hypothetical protein HanPSC8_Chr01g0011801 [Helianthus annuus]|nr:hypothetical protein HanPSC8_Chr01g0011801 [Helianthus annuus]